jgi:hypothetical protein
MASNNTLTGNNVGFEISKGIIIFGTYKYILKSNFYGNIIRGNSIDNTSSYFIASYTGFGTNRYSFPPGGPYVTVELRSTPPQANIYIDNEETGESTNQIFYFPKPQEHNFILREVNYETYEGKFNTSKSMIIEVTLVKV